MLRRRASKIERPITEPLAETVRAVDISADGDVTVRVGVDSSDEIGHMAKALNRQLGSQQDLMARINIMSQTLTQAADGLTGISTSLAASSEEARRKPRPCRPRPSRSRSTSKAWRPLLRN
jgi:methyl-accepting chemotaxis protein